MKLFFQKFGSGPPVLILHGLLGTSDNWQPIARALSENYQVFLPDMRNHGRSPHSNEFNYPAMVEDIYEFLTDLNLRNIFLIGHSMGGKIAMNFALEYPHRILKLIVVDIAPRRYTLFHDRILDAMRSIDINALTSRKQADVIMAEYIPDRRIRQFLLKNLYRHDDGSFAWRLNLPVITDQLGEIGREISDKGNFNNPTLFVAGGNSDYIKDTDIPVIQQIFPAAELIRVPGATHWLHSERPELLIGEFMRFLKS